MKLKDAEKYGVHRMVTDKCFKSLYIYDNPPFNMSEECLNDQWEKQDVCLMTQSMIFFEIHGKNIIQA